MLMIRPDLDRDIRTSLIIFQLRVKEGSIGRRDILGICDCRRQQEALEEEEGADKGGAAPHSLPFNPRTHLHTSFTALLVTRCLRHGHATTTAFFPKVFHFCQKYLNYN